MFIERTECNMIYSTLCKSTVTSIIVKMVKGVELTSCGKLKVLSHFMTFQNNVVSSVKARKISLHPSKT